MTSSFARPLAHYCEASSFQEDLLEHKIDSYLMVRKKWVGRKKMENQFLAGFSKKKS
jgi:hypothetical protein